MQTPAERQRAREIQVAELTLDVPHTELFLDGAWHPAAGAATFTVDDPARQRPIAEVADAGPDDAMKALDAAESARPGLEAMPPRERAQLLRHAFDAVMDRADELATLITAEMGKPRRDALAEVHYGAEFLRWFSEQAVRVDGGFARSPAGDGWLLTTVRPVGTCLLVTPWNFPLAMGTRKIGPALAAGCPSIVKPAPQTPLTMLALAGILDDVGVPAGAVNVLPTTQADPVCARLLDDVRVRKLSFTGSTPVGQLLARRAADGVRRVSLELGGNAPFLVFADADLDAAVEDAVVAKLRNGGEACTAANRFLVERPVAEDFTARLSERVREMAIGPGDRSGVEIGPMIDTAAVERIDGLVTDACDRGADLRTGGPAAGLPATFYRPTVLAEVPRDAAILQQEIFGPVAPVVPFEDVEDAITLANATDAGLVSYLQTRDVDRAIDVASRLEAGMVGLNRGVVSNAAAPFGGIKSSGLGREGGREGLAEYLETVYVAL